MDSDDWRERMARLEERMNTMDERYDKGWALLREDNAKRDAESARRETRLVFCMIAIVGVGLTIFGFVTA